MMIAHGFCIRISHPCTGMPKHTRVTTPPLRPAIFADGRLQGKVVAFTTPTEYAARLEHLLKLENAHPVRCPTIVTETTVHTRQQVEYALSKLHLYDGIAFTSRAGINAVAEGLQQKESPLSDDGGPFILAALGKDAELLIDLDLFKGNSRVKMLVPSVSTPQSLAEELGDGNGQRILCPVPFVADLEEPPVVPSFFQALNSNRWIPVRVNAYMTRWAGPHCAEPLFVYRDMHNDKESDLKTDPVGTIRMKDVDAVVFTSTAEVEGLIKGLDALGLEGVAAVRRARKTIVLAAHGPVTAAGAARLGVQVDVVSHQFHSFAGVVDALVCYWKSVKNDPSVYS